MSSSLNILCIDSSTEACSVAVLTKQAELHQRFMLAPREHTQKILPTVDDVIKEAQLNLSDIDVIAYGQGPGSFTGVRIGISIAQGLAFGLEKKMVGISTLQAMAQQAFTETKCESVYAAIDARMGEVYFAHYLYLDGVMQLQNKEIVIQPDSLIEVFKTQSQNMIENSLLVGTGWSAYPQLLSFFEIAKITEILYPDAAYMFDEAIKLISEGAAVEPELATPVYLRDTVTWKKLPGRE
ncbi:tRNA (adenosine(37)-N6)-threonylcarbamoyltransferase complex dimerization subunit type 1 TsaB [Psychromonas sp. RZ22]|uniref:tRNA (adenosine(37)-N6)-threonylcarbamoyltransferase complex dimerization subunit type 1 TsaB n=1 Tax=Psychromonas algarum TaxID=2555643 RepID=UPI00106754F2|nr:tRNA (adenosine(37)-N6)-threonylcarbamoyltransferase complex dimerization subunit type 1 TsaB [Psychromonas sp. RZ22]TEW55246.1 tRNA (adenosine(37)-N6)-threonylcarbamoyltransferase complex dimerization subunit type 1 TsaB [Psychromonas sp. RZ22]